MTSTESTSSERQVTDSLPSTEDSNSKAADDQTQEEVTDSKQQQQQSSSNQSWVASNRPSSLNKGIRKEPCHIFDATEDYALHYLTRAVLKMIDNIGFVMCQENVLYLLVDLCRRYMQKLWADSKVFAEHAGRQRPIFEDADMVFRKFMFSAAELHSFMKQVEQDPMECRVPLFPIRKYEPNLINMYGPVSEKELADRPEYIPRYYPAVHPEWCADRIVRAIESKNASRGLTRNSRYMPRERVTKSKISFPDFIGSTAKELGFVRPQKLPPKKVIEEPSGILSSANIAAASAAANNATTKTKHRKWSHHEATGSLRNVDEHHIKIAEVAQEKDAADKPTTQRSNGMFGMPPLALVHPEIVTGEKVKKKKKDKDRDKDRSKEKKGKHRDKEKHKDKKIRSGILQGQETGTTSSAQVVAEILTHDKPTTSSAIAEIIDQERKQAKQQQQDVSVPSGEQPSCSENRPPPEEVTNLKNAMDEERRTEMNFPYAVSTSDEDIPISGKEEDADRLKHGQIMNLRVTEGDSVSGAATSTETAKVVKPHYPASRAEEQMDEGSISFDDKLVEKVKEAMKEGIKKDGKGNASAKGKSEKRKSGEKSKEGIKIAKKSTAESSLSIVSPIIDNTAQGLTMDIPIFQDLKTLKVVLSRPSGQKEFTAISPSSGTDRIAAKDAEQIYGQGDVRDNPVITTYVTHELQVSEGSHEKKKKHKKDKDRDKHHSKEHKKKEKKKDKEHKKDKTKDKEGGHGKHRSEKIRLKRPGEPFPQEEMPTPKIPKLKIRLGSNPNSVGASPSSVVSAASPTVLSSTVLSVKLPERDVSASVGQDIRFEQTVINIEDVLTATQPLKSDTAKPRKRPPITKAELKALPKLSQETSTYGSKECIKFTSGQESAESISSQVIFKADVESEQGNYVQQPTGKRLRTDDQEMGDFTKDVLERCFGHHDVATFSSNDKAQKGGGKEKPKNSNIRGLTSKRDVKYGLLVPADVVSAFLSDDRFLEKEKELPKKDQEVMKKKPDQEHMVANEGDLVPTKSGKEKDNFGRASDSHLWSDREKFVVKDSPSGKSKSKDPEKEKKKEKHHRHDLGKTDENGREKSRKSFEKEKDQKKREEKSVGRDEEKRGQEKKEKEKVRGCGSEKKKIEEKEKGKVKGKGNTEKWQDQPKEKGEAENNKVAMRDVSISSGWNGESNKKQGKGSWKEQLKRKSLDKEAEHGRNDMKKTVKGRGLPVEAKGKGQPVEAKGKDLPVEAKGKDLPVEAKGKDLQVEAIGKGIHRHRSSSLEKKVKGHEKDYKLKEGRKKHSGGRKEEHFGKGKEIGKVLSNEGEIPPKECGASNSMKTKNSNKGDELVGGVNKFHVSSETVRKTEQAGSSKEQLSQRYSADSDIYGTGSSSADSLAKPLDKKSAALESEDSLDNMWICPECSVAYVEGATDMVGCDACDNWFHWSCVGLLVAPPDDVPWFCQACAKKKHKKKGLSKSSTSKKGRK